VGNKKKHKKHKKLKEGGALALVAALLSQAIGQILGDAVEVAAERLEGVQDKARRAMKKKKRDAVATAHAVAP
jgi:hypothetical protein